MARMKYARDSDIVSTLVTPTVESGVEDTDYPPEGLTDKNPAKPAKLTGTTGAYLWDFLGAQRVDGIFIPHHNLDEALSVNVQMNATDSWGGASLDEAMTVPAYEVNGFPVGFWLDLVGKTGYLEAGYQFLRVEIAGTNTNAIAIGEIILTDVVRDFPFNINWGVRFGDRSLSVINTTDWGVVAAFDRGTFRRTITGEVVVKDAEFPDFRNLDLDISSQARAFVLVPDGDLNEVLYVRSVLEGHERQADFTDNNRIPLRFEEVSRGLVL